MLCFKYSENKTTADFHTGKCQVVNNGDLMITSHHWEKYKSHVRIYQHAKYFIQIQSDNSVDL